MTVRSAIHVFGWLCGLVLFVSCGGDDAHPGSTRDGGIGSGTRDDAGAVSVKASDPCLSSGYYFDGKSDCDVVRCPELSCKCTSSTSDAGPAISETVSLHACVPGRGCVARVDCASVCDPTARLPRLACEQRLASTGAACKSDQDCVTGHCREETSGMLCVDMLGCGSDGHCSAGFTCRFDPSSLDAKTKQPNALGSCSNGAYQSVCYTDAQCKYHKCSGNRCSGGRDNDPCESDAQCASGFCRIAAGSMSNGSCVSGAVGGSCIDDQDCSSGLHCTSGTCYSAAVGQACDGASDCASGLCVSSVCRGGEPGSVCQEDAHCKQGVCAGGLCVSGGLLSPCYEAADCKNGLRCARQVCTDGSAGSPCGVDADCTVRACVRETCSAGENGAVCEAPDDCQSNRCADPAGVEPGVCTSGDPGSPCVYAQNCASMSCSAQGKCN
jgi:hypothetical protein